MIAASSCISSSIGGSSLLLNVIIRCRQTTVIFELCLFGHRHCNLSPGESTEMLLSAVTDLILLVQ